MSLMRCFMELALSRRLTGGVVGRIDGRKVLLLWLGCCAVFAGQAAESRVQVEPGVLRGVYSRWGDALYLDSDRQVTAVVLPGVGGRIVHYSLAGDNILFEQTGSEGKSLAQVKGWFAMGGHATDVGPERAGSPERLDLLLGPYDAKVPDDYTVTVRSAKSEVLGVQLEREVVMDPERGELGLSQRLINTSDKEVTYSLCDRTRCRAGGYVVVPLKKNSRYKSGWARHRVMDGGGQYDGETPVSERVQVRGGLLVAWAGGEATKVGTDSDGGWVAYVRGRLLFVKYFRVDPQGTYDDSGNTLGFYFDQQIAELGPASPEARLKPGEVYEFPEKWVLIQLKREVSSFEDARAAIKRMPDSPFNAK